MVIVTSPHDVEFYRLERRVRSPWRLLLYRAWVLFFRAG